MDTNSQGKIFNVIADQLGVALDDIRLESRIVDDLGADSLDSVELVMALEDAFTIQIEESVSEKFVTVKDVVDFVNRLAVAA